MGSLKTKMKFLYMSMLAFGIAYAEQDVLIINNITVNKLKGDTAPSEFSTIFKFKINEVAHFDKDWQIGFYMPRSFSQSDESHGNYNPNLNMNICELSHDKIIGACAQLELVKTPITQTDKSQGTLTILKPVNSFTLKSNTTYMMSLLHNNQFIPVRYSDMPQSIFIASDNLSWNIPTSFSNYSFPLIESVHIPKAIESHNLANWTNSQQYQANDSTFTVVPSVVASTRTAGVFKLSDSLVIHNVFDSVNSQTEQLQNYLLQDLNLNSQYDYSDSSLAKGDIVLKTITDPKEINNNPEGYKIIITDEQITIEAMNKAGLFYAIQTLRQLWYNGKTISTGTIIDYPRFKYRGVLVDVSRHYFSMSDLKKTIDVLAAHKINTLHLHLSDDEAFRLALDSVNYNIASARGGDNTIGAAMLVQQSLDKTYQEKEDIYPQADVSYVGSYSKYDIAELIKYANNQQITIIPELDFPGHARALIKSDPATYANINDTSKYISVQGYTDDVLAICRYKYNKDFTKQMDRIINETISWFKKQNTLYAVNNEISIGGDEVAPTAWTEDSECESTEYSQLDALSKSHLFFREISSNNPNLKISGWQQFVQNENDSIESNSLSAGMVGHVWVWNPSGSIDGTDIGIKQAHNLIDKNYKTVLAFADNSYFDIAYTPSKDEPGFQWSTPYSDTHAALDIVSNIAKLEKLSSSSSFANVDGVEGTLWSENIPALSHLEYMAIPKLAGLSEAAWSSETITYNKDDQINWQSLANRLGSGFDGRFLDYLSNTNKVTYRGYPDGISLEIPSIYVK